MSRIIYADYNATTPLCSGSLEKMAKAQEIWGNPSSAHALGRKANELLEASRRDVASAAEVDPTEVVFTSGGSEANTLALMGLFLQTPAPFRVLTSRVEHSSVKDTVKCLVERGAKAEYARLLPSGQLDRAHFETLLTEFRPHLVSLMTANNETGVVFPIPEIVAACRKAGVTVHTDAVQAFGKVPASFWREADLISISAHKIHGPKGIGALLTRRGTKLVPTHYGGSQEIKRRGGTENTIGIAGFAGACAELNGAGDYAEVGKMRDRFEAAILRGLEGVSLPGGETERLPNTSNFRFHGIPSEILLGALDLEGVCISAGSACSSGSISPSHVLLEMGLSPQEARECVRVSWGRPTTMEDVDTAAGLVLSQVARIQARRRSQ